MKIIELGILQVVGIIEVNIKKGLELPQNRNFHNRILESFIYNLCIIWIKMIKLINPKTISLVIERADDIYCKEKGINKSSFMRQAIKLHAEGKLEYKYVEEK